MSGPNTLGTPKTDDYNLGRGKLYISTLDANNLITSWRDMGNVTDFKNSITTNTIDHKSSQQALKVIDRTVVIDQASVLSFKCDELSNENLAKEFSGNKASYTNPAVAGFTIGTMIVGANLQANYVASPAYFTPCWFDVVTPSTKARCYDITAANLTLATDAVSPVSLVQGTDYLVDTRLGRVQLLNSTKIKAAAALNGAAGGNITAVVTADSSASGVDQVQVLTTVPQKVALKFVSVNASNNGVSTEYQFHSVLLAGEGDFSLIADTFTEMSFKGTAGANPAVDPNSPYCTIRTLQAPRT